MPRRLALFAVLVAALTSGCDSANLNTQQMIFETQDAIVQLRSELAIFQDEIDSLRAEFHVQDSLMRDLANQLGRPLPPKAVVLPPP